MIAFDFQKINTFVPKDKREEYIAKKQEVFSSFQKSEMTGWVREIDSLLVSKIKEKAQEVKSYSDCLVVIGIGGSFLASYALKEALQPYFKTNSFPILYAGTTLSSEYMKELLNYLDTVDFSINVISKS